MKNRDYEGEMLAEPVLSCHCPAWIMLGGPVV
jgi:hypothetical protein